MQADFDQTTGRLIFSSPDMPDTIIQGGVAWVSYRGEQNGKLYRSTLAGQGCNIDDQPVTDIHGSAEQYIIQCPTTPDGIGRTYRIRTYNQRPYLLLQLSLRNRGVEPIYLKECCLLQAAPSGGGRVKVDASDTELRFFKVGWHGWDYTGLKEHRQRNSSSV